MFNSIVRMSRGVSLLLAVFSIGVIARAQVSTASITGVVQDLSGAVVPGATVVATQTKTNASSTVVSDGSGSFSLPALPVGPYTLKVSAAGFGTQQQSGLNLTVGEVASLRIQLAVGDVQQTVNVSDAAPLIDATSATLENTIDQNSVVNLPLNGRNPAALVFDVAGAIDSVHGQVQVGQLAAQSEIVPSGITIPVRSLQRSMVCVRVEPTFRSTARRTSIRSRSSAVRSLTLTRRRSSRSLRVRMDHVMFRLRAEQ